MSKASANRPCSSCTGNPEAAVVQRFTRSREAFAHHTRLVVLGLEPSLCMRRDGSLRVCHAAPAERAQAVSPAAVAG